MSAEMFNFFQQNYKSHSDTNTHTNLKVNHYIRINLVMWFVGYVNVFNTHIYTKCGATGAYIFQHAFYILHHLTYSLSKKKREMFRLVIHMIER